MLFARVGGDSPRARVHDVGLEVVLHKDLGDQRLPPSQDLEGTVSRLVPRAMFNFFFFKGEELAQRLLAPSPEVRVLDELKRLLYQSEWEAVLEACSSARAVIGRELAKLADKEREHRDQQAVLGDLADSIKKLKGRARDDKTIVAGLERQLTVLEADIHNLAAASDPSVGQRLQDRTR